MLQQTKNIVYLCLKSVQMFGKERGSPCIQQFCFCQSGALNGSIFGEYTKIGFDFNYQLTSSVEKHNTVWRCERSNVLAFYLTPVTITVHCLKGAASIFASS